MKTQRTARWVQKAEQRLSIPVGTVSDTPRVELVGRTAVRIEGTCSIHGCEEESVLLHTGDGALRIQGRDLCITSFDDDSLELTGVLVSLEFLE